MFEHPAYDIVSGDRDGLLKQIAGSGFARPAQAQAPSLPASAPSKGVEEWVDIAKKKQAQKNLQTAFSEVLKARAATGKKFLSETQLMQVLTKHIPMSDAKDIATRINKERERVTKHRLVTTTDPVSKKTTTRLVPDEELKGKKGITSGGLTRKEQLEEKLLTGERSLASLTEGERYVYGADKKKRTAPTMKKVKNETGGYNWFKYDPDQDEFVDTGLGAKPAGTTAPKLSPQEQIQKEAMLSEYKSTNKIIADLEKQETEARQEQASGLQYAGTEMRFQAAKEIAAIKKRREAMQRRNKALFDKLSRIGLTKEEVAEEKPPEGKPPGEKPPGEKLSQQHWQNRFNYLTEQGMSDEQAYSAIREEFEKEATGRVVRRPVRRD